jgi:NADPH:quinone reductase-like Zn-dependent oxidoreductase
MSMKSVVIDKFGGPEVLRIAELPEPKAAPGEIVVDIHATSINPADTSVRRGQRQNVVPGNFPQTLGRDFSGVVREVGAGVTDFKPGDPVFAVCKQGKDGSYAEAIAIEAAICCRKPVFLSHTEAAALALIGLTALVSIEDTLKLKKGERILIQGGAGGVGSYGVQLAHHLGATVFTTASARNHEYLKAFGADTVIDYNTQDFTKIATGMDCVFDTVGGNTQTRSYECLKPGGRLAWIAPGEPDAKPHGAIQILRPDVQRDRPHLERVAELARIGAVKVPEIQTLKLDEIRKAHELSETKHVRGKIVLQVR